MDWVVVTGLVAVRVAVTGPGGLGSSNWTWLL